MAAVPLVFGFDTETHLIGAGNLMPRLVCASFDYAEAGLVSPTSDIRDTFRAWVTSNSDDGYQGLLEQLLAMFDECFHKRAHIVIQNTAFDLCVVLRYCRDVIDGAQKGNPKRAAELFQLIWDLLDMNLDSELAGTGVWLHDTIIRQKLFCLSTIGMVEYQEKGRDVSFSLDSLVKRWFDVDISAGKVTTDLHGRVFDSNNVDITGTPKAGAAWRLRYSELDGVPINQWPAEAKQYAIDDATWARKGFEWQEARRQPRYHGSMNSESLQVYADTALRLFSATGFRVDRAQVNKVAVHIDEELAKSNVALELNGIVRPNGSVCQAVLHERIKAAWLQAGRYPLLTDTGEISASAEVMEELAGVDPVLDLYASRQGIVKIKTSFLPNLGGDLVWSNYDVLKETGRVSSYGNSDKSRRKPLYAAVNIQQIPKSEGVRECFLPPADFVVEAHDATAANAGNLMCGYVMCSTDYASLELCSVAQVTYNLLGFSVHRDKINMGYDLHSYLGSGMAMSLEPYAVDIQNNHDEAYKALVRYRKAIVKDEDTSPEAERLRGLKKKAIDWRNFSKPVGLGYPGGLGPKTLVTLGKTTYGVTMTEDQATTFRELWRQVYPEMPMYFQWVNKQLDPAFPGGDLYCYETQGYNRFRAAATYCATANGKAMQSLSADGAKCSVCWLARAMMGGLTPESPYALLDDCLPLAFIHDENLTAIPDDLLMTERALMQAQLQIEAMKISMPDVTIGCEPAVMRRWIKVAEPIWQDEPGREAQVRAALDQLGWRRGVAGYAAIVINALGPTYKPNRRLVPWDDVHKGDKPTAASAPAPARPMAPPVLPPTLPIWASA